MVFLWRIKPLLNFNFLRKVFDIVYSENSLANPIYAPEEKNSAKERNNYSQKWNSCGSDIFPFCFCISLDSMYMNTKFSRAGVCT